MKKKFVSFLKNQKSAAASSAAIVAASASGVASADIGATITSAFTAGQTNLGLAAAGVITMVAVLTGIGLIVSMLRK